MADHDKLDRSPSLRRMSESDLAQVLEWRNTDRIRGSMFMDRVILWEQHQAWYRRIKDDPSTVYLIFEYWGVPAGVVNFSRLDSHHRKGEWGFYLGSDDLPRGTGTIMGKLGLKFAFEELGLHKLIGEALVANEASVNFHLKLGFVQEGYFKDHILKNGKFEDVISFALLEEHYLQRRFTDE